MLVYLITCNGNGRKYVGSTTKTFKYRVIDGHFRNLRLKRHGNSWMQNSWNKYGKESFEAEILEDGIKSIKLLLEIEDAWMEKLMTLDPSGFNLQTASLCLHSESTKKRISEARKNQKRRPFSKEACKNISEGKKRSKHHLRGKHHPEETKEKLRRNIINVKNKFLRKTYLILYNE